LKAAGLSFEGTRLFVDAILHEKALVKA